MYIVGRARRNEEKRRNEKSESHVEDVERLKAYTSGGKTVGKVGKLKIEVKSRI